MSDISERHVRYARDSNVERGPDDPEWCAECFLLWPCETITADREREAETKRADEAARMTSDYAALYNTAEQDAARLAEVVRSAERWLDSENLVGPSDLDAALRLHDERVKGGTT